MGHLPSRNTMLKIFLFLAIYGSMMMWRRMQFAACQENRLVQHVAYSVLLNNETKHFPRTDDVEVADRTHNSNDHIWNNDNELFELTEAKRLEFSLTLSVKADQNRTVIISVVDEALKEFALNFYMLSLKKHSITNFIFVCLDISSQSYLQLYGISCLLFVFPNISTVPQSNTVSKSKLAENADFGSDQYYTKTNVKTLFVLETLRQMYNVLICDVDVIFFKYPLNYLSCDSCDLMISLDREYWNSGFVYVKPTERSLLLYTRAWKLYNYYHMSHDQAYLNMAHRLMLQDGLSANVVELSWRQFPCGYYYFQQDFREFINEPACKDCIIVHNNYIGSTAAKKYRFRENLLWVVDTNGYYSESNAKYLSYENPLEFGLNTHDAELNALKSALIMGFFSNRVVILPTFHCCDCKTKKCYNKNFKCSLLHVTKLKTFDEVFTAKYRENSFMSNDLVPSAIKSSDIMHLHISSADEQTHSTPVIGSNTKSDPSKTFIVQNSTQNEDFKAWLKQFENMPVLFFESVYVNLLSLLTTQEHAEFKLLFDKAFQCTDYEQWEVKPFV